MGYIGFSKNLMFFTIYDENLFLQNKFYLSCSLARQGG